MWIIASILILISGIYFTFKLKFVQFRFLKMFKSLFIKGSNNGITPFNSLMMVLGGRIGVGSVAGVAFAIYYGGIGSIFWMWIIGFISASLSYAETYLGLKYKEKDENSIYKGGPSYYLKKGLHNNKLGNIYAIIIIISYIFGFITIQANTIVKLISINKIFVGMCITILSAIIINKGIKGIVKASTKIVPLMTLLYVLIATYILILNIDQIPIIFNNIIESAFNFRSGISGVLVGIQRGIFSNEAGLGTGAIASSVVETNDYKSSYTQIIGVYITTFLICTSTAIIILTSNYGKLVLNDLNGIEITSYAFLYHLGDFGNYFIIFIIILFAFSTILSGYYDCESSLKYFKLNKYIVVLKIITLLVLFISSIVSSTIIWNIVDSLVVILAYINIYALIKLRKEVKIC